MDKTTVLFVLFRCYHNMNLPTHDTKHSWMSIYTYIKADILVSDTGKSFSERRVDLWESQYRKLSLTEWNNKDILYCMNLDNRQGITIGIWKTWTSTRSLASEPTIDPTWRGWNRRGWIKALFKLRSARQIPLLHTLSCESASLNAESSPIS